MFTVNTMEKGLGIMMVILLLLQWTSTPGAGDG